MPKLYDTVKLCSHTYNDEVNLPEGWQLVVTTESMKENLKGYPGYYAQAYICGDECVIVHRGTSFKNIATAGGNLSNDSSIALSIIPRDSEAAIKFSQEVMNKYKGKKFIQAGHSLGGVHAHVCAIKLKNAAITFDPPGCLAALTQYIKTNKIKVAENQLNQHYTFLSERNLINEIYSQFGHVFRKIRNTLDVDNYFNCSTETLDRHSLKTLEEIIMLDSPDPFLPTTQPKQIQNFALIKEAEKKLHQPEIIKVPDEHEANSVFHEQLKIHARQGVLSMLKTPDGEHVFLILESIQNNEFRLVKFDCVRSDESKEDIKKKVKVRIIPTDINYLKEYAKGHQRSSWPVSVAQIQRLEHLMVMERARSLRGEIDYFWMGKASSVGSVGKSLTTAGSASLQEQLLKKCGRNSVLQALLLSGHNCYSWSQAVLEAIELVPPKNVLSNFSECFIKAPSIVFNKELKEEGKVMLKQIKKAVAASSEESKLDSDEVLDAAAEALPGGYVGKVGVKVVRGVAKAAAPYAKDSAENSKESLEEKTKECVENCAAKQAEKRIKNGAGSAEEKCNELVVKPALRGAVKGMSKGFWDKHANEKGILPYQNQRIASGVLIIAMAYVLSNTEISWQTRLLLLPIAVVMACALNLDTLKATFKNSR